MRSETGVQHSCINSRGLLCRPSGMGRVGGNCRKWGSPGRLTSNSSFYGSGRGGQNRNVVEQFPSCRFASPSPAQGPRTFPFSPTVPHRSPNRSLQGLLVASYPEKRPYSRMKGRIMATHPWKGPNLWMSSCFCDGHPRKRAILWMTISMGRHTRSS